jgi:hypothetical protein
VLQGWFSTLEIHFLFFKNEFHEGTYSPQSKGTKESTPLWGVRTRPCPACFPFTVVSFRGNALKPADKQIENGDCCCYSLMNYRY